MHREQKSTLITSKVYSSMPSGSPSQCGSSVFRTREADHREVYKELKIAENVYHIEKQMTFLSLLLLVAPSFALQFTVPTTFGGKTDYSDRGWQTIMDQLSSQMDLGKAPTSQISIAQEPTCLYRFTRCVSSYFGKDLALTEPESAQLWVKWHQDAQPFACDHEDGCSISSTYSVADLTSQTKGWGVTASLNASAAIKDLNPAIKGDASVGLTFGYSNRKIESRTVTSSNTFANKCKQNHICFLQTGTLMMTVTGSCESKPVINCDRTYYPCEEFNTPNPGICSQWDTFTRKYCEPGDCIPYEDCTLSVAVTGSNDSPISFQVLEQLPFTTKRSVEKRDGVQDESLESDLPDGSSGAWMVWSD